MPLELQAKLLRVLQSGEVTPVGGKRAEQVDVRIVAATHRDLDAARARRPLPRGPLYRLNVVPIAAAAAARAARGHPAARRALPRALRARSSARGPRWLAEAALEQLCALRLAGQRARAGERDRARAGARDRRRAHARRLRVPRGARAARRRRRGGCARGAGAQRGRVAAARRRSRATSTARIVERVERPLLEVVLEHTGGNQLRAAAILGINRNTLRKKITELGIDAAGAALTARVAERAARPLRARRRRPALAARSRRAGARGARRRRRRRAAARQARDRRAGARAGRAAIRALARAPARSSS